MKKEAYIAYGNGEKQIRRNLGQQGRMSPPTQGTLGELDKKYPK